MILAAGVLTLAACGSGAAEPPAGSSAVAQFTVENYAFPAFSVAPGAAVTVLDADGEPHTVTAVDGSFDTGSFDAATPGAFTAPTRPGSYAISCQVHPSMHGTIVVLAPEGTP